MKWVKIHLIEWDGSGYKSPKAGPLPDISFMRPTVLISQRWAPKELTMTNFKIGNLKFQRWVKLSWIGTRNHQTLKPAETIKIIYLF